RLQSTGRAGRDTWTRRALSHSKPRRGARLRARSCRAPCGAECWSFPSWRPLRNGRLAGRYRANTGRRLGWRVAALEVGRKGAGARDLERGWIGGPAHLTLSDNAALACPHISAAPAGDGQIKRPRPSRFANRHTECRPRLVFLGPNFGVCP